MHCRPEYPLHCPEARSKWFLYPSRGGSYYYPSLYVDGKDRGSSPSAWEGYISTRLSASSDVSLTHVGTTYDTITRTGQVQVECYNSGVDDITAALQFAITEDSVYYSAANGDQWHNAVCRDLVPDQLGTAVTLPAGGRDTVTVAYELQPGWVADRVELVVYLQNMSLQPDSALPCYQALTGNALDFVPGVAESKPAFVRGLTVQVSPNPCRARCEFELSGAVASGAHLSLYAPDGRLVSSLDVAGNRATWNRAGAARGVYFYRVDVGKTTTEGKLVVTD